MTADFAKMQEIFLAAVEQHSPDQWDGYLDQACAGDAELLAQRLRRIPAANLRRRIAVG